MTIQDIKKKLNISQLNLNTANDVDGNPTDWLRHWDNDNRVAVSIHKETIKAIQQDKTTNLGIQTSTRTGTKGDYTAHRIVKYKAAEVVL